MTNTEFPLLLNLARRLRLARQCFFRAKREGNCPKVIVAEMEGAMREAWNSFQAAKQIVYAPKPQEQPLPHAYFRIKYPGLI